MLVLSNIENIIWRIVNMSVEEFYEEIGGDYQDIFSRLEDDKVIKCALLMFLKDENYNKSLDNIKNNNLKEAFFNIHTLKGICRNLSFSNMYIPVEEITEALRTHTDLPSDEWVDRLKSEYEKIVCAIHKII